MTCIIYFGLLYKFVFKKVNLKIETYKFSMIEKIKQSNWTKWVILGFLFTNIIVFVALDSYGDQQRIISLIGLILILLTSYLREHP